MTGFKARLRWAVAGALVVTSCGARSSLKYGPPKPPPPECTVDADCEGFGDLCKPVACQPDDEGTTRCAKLTPKSCDDGDPCTLDVCDPATAACTHPLATLDLDGDGHRAPRPGFAPGAPGSCGDDCDDTNANAHPGGVEVCDGVDNDCNGVVDDNAAFVPIGDQAVRINGDNAPAGTAGLGWDGTSYAASYTGTTSGFSSYISLISPDGVVLNPPGEQQVTIVNADASGGPLLWVGDRYGTAWQDRRTGDYEIYFTLLDGAGVKKHQDTQLTDAAGFSIGATMAWNGTEFLVVWQDDRNGPFNLFGQRVSVDGAPVGGNIALTNDTKGLGSESPSVAAGVASVGVASSLGDALSHVVQFQTFSVDLTQPLSEPIKVTDGTTDAVYPTVVWNRDRYVVAWYDKSKSPKAIYAAALAEDGTVLVPPRPITDPGPFRSRYPFLRPLGDRLLVVYADDRDQNDGYEIYSRMISKDLDPLGIELRITTAGRDSIYPIAAFGPEGNVGVLFRDDREAGKQNVFFTRLGCVSTTP